MEIKVGNKRWVIVIGNWIVVKLPKIHLLTALRVFWRIITEGRPFLHFRKYDYTMSGAIQNFLLAGLVENWKEFVYWKKFHFNWLAPTYLSLYGFVNFQKAGEEMSLEKDGVFWCQISECFGNEVYKGDEHVFAEDKNYVLIDDKVCLVDYGNFRNRTFFVENEKQLREFEFNLPE